MPPLDFGMAQAPFGFAITFDTQQSEEQNEGGQMEIVFSVALKFHPIELEGTFNTINIFDTTWGFRSLNIHVFVEVIAPCIDLIALMISNATVNVHCG